ncbi:RHS repeat-associated protein [Thermodesulfitimonas autotrophica]|uniref:RHS repeat-associated protein n=1 Tax=Thermodesulfitimonas autotrophica TaxID=1894989 RepID=A0A3N5APR8_9THEO|nr:RHS repeat-associated core domain-containing protein [Thermodesulfitimonas autotrophica]RPF46827.1 RHS repeat-associated protein [Thermodesulfitimonas autotrophica]
MNGKLDPELLPPEAEVTRYVNDVSLDAPEVLLTADGEGNYLAAYSYGLDLLSVAHLDNTRPASQEPLYYLQDGLGSVRQLVTPAGKQRAKYDYDPFGLPLTGGKLPGANENVLYNPYGFTGEQHDRETGFIYLRARYYDPEVGRFISKDPFPGLLSMPLSQNGYSYVENNPVNFTDPLGLRKQDSKVTPGKNTRPIPKRKGKNLLDSEYPYGIGIALDYANIGSYKRSSVEASLWPPKFSATGETGVLILPEFRSNGTAATKCLGISGEAWAGASGDIGGIGLGGKAYLVEGERTWVIGAGRYKIELTVRGTLGSIGAAAGVDISRRRLKFGYHEWVGLEGELRITRR